MDRFVAFGLVEYHAVVGEVSSQAKVNICMETAEPFNGKPSTDTIDGPECGWGVSSRGGSR